MQKDAVRCCCVREEMMLSCFLFIYLFFNPATGRRFQSTVMGEIVFLCWYACMAWENVDMCCLARWSFCVCCCMWFSWQQGSPCVCFVDGLQRAETKRPIGSDSLTLTTSSSSVFKPSNMRQIIYRSTIAV